MRSCDDYGEMISEMLDQELKNTDEAELMAHIEVCPSCKRMYEAFKSISANIGQNRVPMGFSRGVMNNVKKQHMEQHRAPKFKPLKLTLAIASCIAVVILAFSYYHNFDILNNSKYDNNLRDLEKIKGETEYSSAKPLNTPEYTQGDFKSNDFIDENSQEEGSSKSAPIQSHFVPESSTHSMGDDSGSTLDNDGEEGHSDGSESENKSYNILEKSRSRPSSSPTAPGSQSTNMPSFDTPKAGGGGGGHTGSTKDDRMADSSESGELVEDFSPYTGSVSSAMPQNQPRSVEEPVTDIIQLEGMVRAEVFSGARDDNPLLTVTDADALTNTADVLSWSSYPPSDIEISDPVYTIKAYIENGTVYTLRVWTKDDNVYCAFDNNGILFMTKGTISQLNETLHIST